MEGIKSIRDIIDMDALQKMQDNFAEAVGMAFIAVDYKGTPLIEHSGFSEFCAKARENKEFKELCYQCDAHGGLHAAITGKPHIYICHAGLIDFAVPLIHEGNYYGAIMGGQISTVYENLQTDYNLERIIERRSKCEDYPELVEDYSKVKSISFNRIEAVVTLMFEHVQALMEQGHVKHLREELETKNVEILEEKSRRLEREKDLRINEEFVSAIALRSAALFSNLSVISRLAYIEKAVKTENYIYVLSDMLRYTVEGRNSQISTLGEEVAYIENYLKLQSISLEERLNFNIDVDEEFFSAPCPFMILQPIVENSIKYAVESRKAGGEITITSFEKGDGLIVSIKDDGPGISKEIIDNIMNEDEMVESEIHSYDLYNINKRLAGLFGKKYRLTIKNVSEGVGTVVNLKLPTKGNLMK